MAGKTLRELALLVASWDDEVALAQEALNEATRRMKEAEDELHIAMQEQGTDIVRVPGLTLTVKEKKRPQAKDWQAFYAFLIANNAPQLLERRISAKAFDEMIEARGGVAIPGVEIYEYSQLQKRRG